jgi:hypothetical protein
MEFEHKILGLFGGLLNGVSGGFRDRGGEETLSTIGRGLSCVFFASSGHTGSSRLVFQIFTPEGKRPRSNRGHDKGDRRSWGIERKGS